MNEGKIAPKARLLTNAIRHIEERKTNGNSLRKIGMISMPLPSPFINSPSVGRLLLLNIYGIIREVVYHFRLAIGPGGTRQQKLHTTLEKEDNSWIFLPLRILFCLISV